MRIAALTGLAGAFGEPLQGQRYAVGQEFKGHTDYFEPPGADYERCCGIAGNRTWTVMVYLNEPQAGGATRFKAVTRRSGPRRASCSPGTTAVSTAPPTRRLSTRE